MQRDRLDGPRLIQFFHKEEGRSPVSIELQFRRADDTVYGRVLKKGEFYERPLLMILKKTVPHGGLYVDVGAHCGNHSVFFGKFMADRVLAIEPSGEACAALQSNLTRNGIADFVVAQATLGSESGSREVPEYMGGVRQADVETLDELIARCRQWGKGVRLLKIDTDGMDLDVLRGAVGVLSRDRPWVVVEAETTNLRTEIPKLMKSLSYVSKGWHAGQQCLLFAPKRKET